MLDRVKAGTDPAEPASRHYPPRIGKYLIERELGRGGMGAVYVGVHEHIGKRVAIKVLLPNATDGEEMLQRFLNEARASSAIRHPGIVDVFDYGVDEGRAYIVMELLEGTSLATRLRKLGALPVPQAIAIARQTALALAAAHDAGIVHRDLKPDNIFLRSDGGNASPEKVVVLDFGIAKLAPFAAPGTAQTMTGALLGTPQYMSPEQCEGARDVDHRSDLYSLGCTLFHMLTGRLPFEANGLGGYIGAHLHVAPPRLRDHLPTASPALESIVDRLLAKAPAARFQSATAVAKALAGSEVTDPSRVVALPEVRALPKLGWHRHRHVLFIAAAVAAGIFVFALMSTQGRDRSVERGDAQQPQQLEAPPTSESSILAAASAGDQLAVFAACRTARRSSTTISACIVAACTQGDGSTARAWYREFRRSYRLPEALHDAANTCIRLGIEGVTLDEPPPKAPPKNRRIR